MLEGDYHWKGTGWHIFVKAWCASPATGASILRSIKAWLTPERFRHDFWLSISPLHAAVRTSAGQGWFLEKAYMFLCCDACPTAQRPCRGEGHPKVHKEAHCSMSGRHKGNQGLNILVLSKEEIKAKLVLLSPSEMCLNIECMVRIWFLSLTRFSSWVILGYGAKSLKISLFWGSCSTDNLAYGIQLPSGREENWRQLDKLMSWHEGQGNAVEWVHPSTAQARPTSCFVAIRHACFLGSYPDWSSGLFGVRSQQTQTTFIFHYSLLLAGVFTLPSWRTACSKGSRVGASQCIPMGLVLFLYKQPLTASDEPQISSLTVNSTWWGHRSSGSWISVHWTGMRRIQSGVKYRQKG